MAHHILSPSSSAQWINCTASIAFIEANADRIVPDTGSVYSEEGHVAHDLVNKVLLDPRDGSLWEGVSEEMSEAVGLYVDHCLGLGAGVRLVETAVPLFHAPDGEGTVDFALLSPGRVDIRDLKYGVGVFVDIENNTQLAIYAMSLIDYLDAMGLAEFKNSDAVSMGIVQPRYRGEEKIRVWETTVGALREFCRHILEAAALIQSGAEGVFSPSEKACRWCDAKAICPARHEVLRVLDGMEPTAVSACVVEDLDAPVMNDDAVLRLVANADAIRSILNDAEQYAYDRALAGNPVEGTKLVLGKGGNRVWADDGAAEKLLKLAKVPTADRYKKSLISPAQAEKILKDFMANPKFKAKFDSAITRGEGRKVLALADDPRPAVLSLINEVEVLT